MRSETEIRGATESIYAVICDGASPTTRELQLMLRIKDVSRLGSFYVEGFIAALDWVLGEEWEIMQTPGMIDGFIDFRA